FNFTCRVWSDQDVTEPSGGPPVQINGVYVNLPARSQDVPIYLCPSDPSEVIRPADWADTGNNDPSQWPEGRCSYLASVGTTSTLVPTGANSATCSQYGGI